MRLLPLTPHMTTLRSSISLLLALVTVNAQTGDYNLISKRPSSVAIGWSVQYSCKIINLWTAERHPALYPANAHWSPTVAASHRVGFSTWNPGMMASAGIEQVAETGAAGRYLDELQNGNTQVEDVAVGSVFFNNEQNEDTLPDIAVDALNPLLTAISMIAPSPDWFSGISGLDMRDFESGTWARSVVVETYPWDAGTETGDNYSADNAAEEPHVPIQRITTERVPASNAFLNPAGDDILPVARFECTLREYVDNPTSQYVTVARSTSDQPVTEPATYKCTFDNLWTALRHPINYPGNAHWSPSVMASHVESVLFWQTDSVASPGLELLAETGNISTLVDELSNPSVGDTVVGAAFFNNVTSGIELPDLHVTNSTPLVSVASMIAPSPDWFSGFTGVDMRDVQTGNWFSEITLDTFPMDAGTETGATYNTNNTAQVPPQNVSQLTIGTIPASNVLANAEADDVLPVARWRCSLFQQAACLDKNVACSSHDQCCSGHCVVYSPTRSECAPEKEVAVGGKDDKDTVKLYDRLEFGGGTEAGRGGLTRRRRLRGM